MLDALSSQLMDPDLFAVFCEEFVAETNRLRSTADAIWAAREADLAKTQRALDRLVQALIDGAPASSVMAKMEELEDKRTRLESELAGQSAPPPTLHPSLAVLYREKVANLAAALNTSEAQADSADALRGLIDEVVLTPSNDGYAVDLKGDLAGILAMASGGKGKTAVAGGPSAVSQVSLVAGAGFEPATFRL